MLGPHIPRRLLSTSRPNYILFERFIQPVITASKPKPHVTEQLVKPVGLEHPPTATTRYSRGNSFKDLFDQRKTKERTEELSLEMSKSGMYDMFTFRKTNGKLFLSPKSYWRKDKALYFPHIVGMPVQKGVASGPIEDVMRGKISIVRIFSNRVADKLSREYIRDMDKQLEGLGDGIQLVNINWMENAAKTLILKASLWSLRSSVEPKLQRTFFLCDRDQLPFTIREKLLINNLYTSYILLVDPDLKIRWMACGGASDEEYNLFWRCVRGLQREVTKG